MKKGRNVSHKANVFSIAANLRIISRLYGIIFKESNIEKIHKDFFDNINSKTNFLTKLWQECGFECPIYSFSDDLKEIEENAIRAAKGMEDKSDYITNYDITKQLPHLLSSATLLNKKRENVFLPVEKFSNTSIFPVKENYNFLEIEEKYKGIYNQLISDLVCVLNNAEKDKSILMTSAALDSVFFKYLSNIPAFYTGDSDDISLYEYAKVVSAFACVQYMQKDLAGDDFALIRGDFFSIQNFIFNKDAASKNPANSLRGKSFYVSLMSDIASLYVLEKLNLPYFNLMMNAAGQFVILSNYNEKVAEDIEEIKNKVGNWLYEKYYASVSMGLSVVDCKIEDFNSERFHILLLNLLEEKEKSKATRFNLTEDKKCVFTEYYKNFTENSSKCEYCGIMPKKDNKFQACDNCLVYMQYGQKLRSSKYLYVIESENGEFFDKYSISFDNNDRERAFIRIHIDMQDKADNNYNYQDVIHYRSYVAVDKSDDGQEKIRSFSDIASYSPEGNDANMLAVLKADVDNLGLLFACGLSEKDSSGKVIKGKLTFSRTNMLSRSIHNFFSYHLYTVMKKKAMNIYTVFAGGDDLFLVGRYDEVIKTAKILYDEFARFTNNNNEITISCGIGFYNDGSPVWFMADDAESRLESAKHFREKGQEESIIKGNISLLYGEYKYALFLKEYTVFQEKIKYFDKHIDISHGLLYKLINYCDMKMEHEKEQKENKSSINLNNLLWRSHFHYVLGRLNVKNIPKDVISKEFTGSLKKEIILYFTNFIEVNAVLLKTLIALHLYNERKK